MCMGGDWPKSGPASGWAAGEIFGFTVGEVVRLKSGGPFMTVSGKRSARGLMHCEWFDDLDQDRVWLGEPQMLERVPDAQETIDEWEGREPAVLLLKAWIIFACLVGSAGLGVLVGAVFL